MGGLKEENLTEGYLTEGYLTELADVKLTSGMIEDFKFIKDDILDTNPTVSNGPTKCFCKIVRPNGNTPNNYTGRAPVLHQGYSS